MFTQKQQNYGQKSKLISGIKPEEREIFTFKTAS